MFNIPNKVSPSLSLSGNQTQGSAGNILSAPSINTATAHQPFDQLSHLQTNPQWQQSQLQPQQPQQPLQPQQSRMQQPQQQWQQPLQPQQPQMQQQWQQPLQPQQPQMQQPQQQWQQPLQPQQPQMQQPTTPAQQQPVFRPQSTVIPGQKVSISGMQPGITNLRVALGWASQYAGNVPCDINSQVFMLNQNGKVPGDNWFVFYGATQSPDGSILHNENRIATPGDKETIDIDLARVSPDIKKLVFVVTIYDAKARGHNFSHLSDAYIRLINLSNNKEFICYGLTEYYANVYAMVMGEVYRHNEEWKFNPIGNGTADDLQGLCLRYGVSVH